MLKLAVIGSPISHSRSPQIHGAVFDSLGVEYSYEKIEVKTGELAEFLEYARDNLDGFNLTMPHKKDVLPYIDQMSETAISFSSVNTVRVKDKKLLGHSTDADGYVCALKNKGFDPKGKSVLILGAGGVVKPIASRLADSGISRLCVLNRTVKKAEELVSEILKCDTVFGELCDKEIALQCKEVDILINATPMGMEGVDVDFESTDFLRELQSGALVSDLIYAPTKTTLLKNAEGMGFEIMNGMDMLIFQAILADEIYLDKSLDVNEIYKKII